MNEPETPSLETAEGEAAEALREAAQAQSEEERIRLAGEVVADQLLEAMKTAGISKAKQSVEALRKAELHGLLARSLAEGRVRYTIVMEELDRFRRALSDRSMSANDIKLGILAFDEAAQRLSLIAGKSGGFKYPHKANRARDSLITFARSLHR